MTRKSILILAVVSVLIVAGVYTVAAQNNPTTSTCTGMMQMHGGRGGMMQNGFGNGMMAGDQDTMMTAAAKALGLESTALVEKIHSGQTIAQIAEAQGVKLQDVYDAMLAQAKEHMTAQVTAGTITQAQADEHLTWMKDNIATMPMFGGAAAGNCMGANANGQHGMMGMGMGMMQHGHGMMGMMGRGHGMMGNN